ncbi:sensor histidine kinase [Aliidiomarina celeris]|uniref:sensor histidine kinase n=1 Tax=Aliidiomarina celeris TaxID=2249428 RepID=UPI000DEB6445|nr:HAMP domain-containing sensor histidine kinase [Aliidiomarina celeris]
MIKYALQHRKHSLALFAVILIGVVLTWLSTVAYQQNTFRLWQVSAVAEAERMTAELTFRVEREREPLISLASLYKGSEAVTIDELYAAHAQLIETTERQAPLTLAWVEDTPNGFVMRQTAGGLSWLPVGEDQPLPDALVSVVLAALQRSPALVVGPLFERAGSSYLSMGIVAPNNGRTGVLLTVTNFDQILNELAQPIVAQGASLEIYHPDNLGINFSKLPPLTTPAEAEHVITGNIGASEWQFRWLFDEDYSPLTGNERGAAHIVLGIGLLLTLLAAFAFGTLLFQNIRIETLVALKTKQLKETFEGLQQAQGQLVKQERMAALGSLVAGVAHELSTPISNAMMAASIILERAKTLEKQAPELSTEHVLQKLAPLLEAAYLVQQNTLRAGDLISSFKQVSIDQTSARRREFDLHKTIEQVVATLGPQLRKGEHKLTISITDTISMDSFPGQLGQVLTNLIQNCIVHGYDNQKGGVIQLEARQERCGLVEITVQDFGKGMSEKVRNRVFEPFYTTKLGKGGSGLGLHISFNIVESVLGGTIEVFSTEGSGSRFVLRIPHQAPEASPAKPAKNVDKNA